VNLLLARADSRRREVAVRTALGARRGDLVRQLLTESVLLSSVGGLAGLALARAAMQILVTLRPAGLPRVEEVGIDPIALAFTAGLSIATGLLFGLLPAVQLSRQGVSAVLNESGRSGAQGKVRHIVRRGLVVTQLAFSVILVVGAGLLLRTLVALNQIDLGFNPDRVLTAQVQLTTTDYPTDADVIGFYRQVTERLEVVPGVTSVGAVRMLPLIRTIGDWSITIEGRPLASPNENPNADYQSATPGYFRTMGTTLLRGRLLTNADREDAPLVVVINDTMAERYWPGQDAIGKRFQMGGTGSTRPPMTIVGIVRTSRTAPAVSWRAGARPGYRHQDRAGSADGGDAAARARAIDRSQPAASGHSDDVGHHGEGACGAAVCGVVARAVRGPCPDTGSDRYLRDDLTAGG
jgi:predicted permease